MVPDIDENTNLDVADVVNYIKAMQFAIARLNERPLCNRLLRETTIVFMEGVRGKKNNLGIYEKGISQLLCIELQIGKGCLFYYELLSNNKNDNR